MLVLEAVHGAVRRVLVRHRDVFPVVDVHHGLEGGRRRRERRPSRQAAPTGAAPPRAAPPGPAPPWARPETRRNQSRRQHSDITTALIVVSSSGLGEQVVFLGFLKLIYHVKNHGKDLGDEVFLTIC